MDLVTLGRTLGFSFAAGVNLYATVAILGLAARYGWVDLPPQFQAFNNSFIIGTAIVLYLVEFFADKIPYFDSLWDILHTAIRPLGGALIAVTTLGDASPGVEGLVALLGGTVAAGSHLTKTSTRAVANASPEPVSNWALSFGEDVFVVGLGYLALAHPIAALVDRRGPPDTDRDLCGGDCADGETLVRTVANHRPRRRHLEAHADPEAHFVGAEIVAKRKRRHPTVREHLVIAVAGIGNEVAGVQRHAAAERRDRRGVIQKREASVREHTRQSIEARHVRRQPRDTSRGLGVQAAALPTRSSIECRPARRTRTR